ncbi:AAA-domain-containing protein [Violaceomyces palustris]|uniref:AAA-domain-containing protein n=1 Tax=Violaceomyces palustris TaxID=1673888 RepID=A0ACD0NXJ0_9BASI|nr:AAA-domain-containing protein [Violaceomyces palustris]
MSRSKSKQRHSKTTLARVQFDQSLRSSLVNLPLCLYAPLVDRGVAPQSLVVELDPFTDQQSDGSHQAYYAGWTGMSAAPLGAASFSQNQPSSIPASTITDVVSLSPTLAASFIPPLQQDAVVSIRLLRSPPLLTASAVQVTPLTPDDWEILSIHAEDVEINMLGQVRAAKKGQVIGVHVGRGGKTIVRFKVDSTTPPTSSHNVDGKEDESDPSSGLAVRLSTDTEVIIAPRLRKKSASSQGASDAEKHDLGTAKTDSKVDGPKTADESSKRRSLVSKLLWRVLPSHFGPDESSAGWFDTCVLLPPSDCGLDTDSGTTVNVDYDLVSSVFPNGRVAVTKISCPTADSGPTSAGKDESGSKGNDQGSESKSKALPARPTASAFFSSGEGHLRLPSKSESTPDSLEWPSRHVLVGPGLRRQLGIEDYDLIKLSSPPPGSVPRTTAPGINGENSKDPEEKEPDQTLAGVESILSNCEDAITGTLRARRLHAAQSEAFKGRGAVVKPFAGSSGLLLTGGPGSGKTVVARNISRRLAKDLNSAISTSWVNCSPFSEERVPVLREKFSEWLNNAAWKAPSLLVLDNLDRVIPAEMEHVDSPRARQLAEAFVSRVKETVKSHEVFVLVTSQSNTSLHSLLNSSHLWVENIQLKAPGKDGRRDIISHLVSSKVSRKRKSGQGLEAHELNYVTLAGSTEGYLPADLRDLVERAVHQSAVRATLQSAEDTPKGAATESGSISGSGNQKLLLTMTDFTKAQEGFTPLSLRDVKLETSSVAWSDIGGLVETRRVLRETLEWPTKYAAIFASCPLRLRSGLLLYGYPGCGKTLLASAVAKECGLNFISVKGPEILNKYIGASEKSVRDLFDRAQAAKPCVLFFDEFDSIAPKRGHDSTGVTDRVVNQMLTQMDGAEGLDGVYVLAATSRPDLIDSALLRPGRLDKSLLCDMPNLDDRIDIIRAVSTKVHLDPSVDVRKWAERTEGFSGADLQALLYNAHLETIHESIAAATAVKEGGKEGGKEIQGEKRLKFAPISTNKGSGSGKTLSGAERQALERRLELMLNNNRAARVASATSAKKGLAGSGDAGVKEVGDGSARGKQKTLVEDRHLETSLKSTRPSVPAEEQARLRRIYKSFAGERDADFPGGEASDQIGARSSLM